MKKIAPKATISLERFYTTIQRHCNLIQSYLELPNIEFVIKACRLKPCQLIFFISKKKKWYNKLVVYRWWFDEFGNSLEIDGKKRLIITYNDLRLKLKRITMTDLYAGLTMDRVAKMSSVIHIVNSKDEDLHQDCYLLTFLGLDHYFRSYLYWFGEWQQVSPLLLGIENLLQLAEKRDERYFRELSLVKNCLLGCQGEQAWLSCLPCGPDFREILKEHKMIRDVVVN